MKNQNRRRFLVNSFVLSLLSFMPPAGAWTTRGFRAKRNDLCSTLVGMVRERQSARMIGMDYLDIVPHEADPRLLVALIGADLNLGGKEPATISTMRRLISERIRRDFELGHIVRLHGWLLSVTEVRVCALCALLLPS